MQCLAMFPNPPSDRHVLLCETCLGVVSEISNRLTQTLKRKTKQTNQNRTNQQTRGVDVQYRMCTSVDCVKQVGVVLCDCDPLGRASNL